MKKRYMNPAIEVQEMVMEELLQTVSGGDTGIKYGGEDIGGTSDPCSRLFDGILPNADMIGLQ